MLVYFFISTCLLFFFLTISHGVFFSFEIIIKYFKKKTIKVG